jgi:hypothetical protein
MSLSSLIVQREVATMRQVEEALARQVIYGGDLVTNLLEVARVDEAVLGRLLAESMGLPAAPPGPLPVVTESVRALVPVEMALERHVVPIEAAPDAIVLAVADPLPADVRDQLAFNLGMAVEERIAPAVRVLEAVAAAYGTPLERRMQRLLSRMTAVSAGTGGLSMPPPEPQHSPSALPLPAPPRSRGSSPPPAAVSRPPAPLSIAGAGSMRAMPGRRSTLTSFPAGRVSVPPAPLPQMPEEPGSDPAVVRSLAEGRAGLLQRPSQLPARGGRRRRGPLTFQEARHDADEATDRDALLALFFDFSRQFFEYAALFLVQGDIAEGRDGFGSGAPRERVTGIGVPLDLPSLLARARDKRGFVVGTSVPDSLDAELLRDLQRPRNTEVVVVPLVVRTRAVALLVGDCGDAGIDREATDEVGRFSGVVSKAFERIIVRRKLEGFVAGSRKTGPEGSAERAGHVDASKLAPDAVKRSSAPPPAPAPGVGAIEGPATTKSAGTEPAARAETGASADPAAPGESGTAGELGTTGESAAPAEAPRELPVDPAMSLSGGPVIVATEGILAIEAGETTVAVSSTSFGPELKTLPGLAVRRITTPPIPREEPDDEDEGKSSSQPPTSSRIGRMARAPELRPVLGEAPSPFDQAWIDSGREIKPDHEAPREARADREAHPELDAHEAYADPEALAGDAQLPLSVVVPPHRPPSSRTPAAEELPSVIVDVQRELEAVVDKLLQGEMDELAEGELLRQGEHAVRVLISRFPGPITFERARFATMANPPRASECGPLLRLIARERRVALPFVLERMSHPSPEVRGWATHLLGELAYPDALPALLVALCDEDEATRASAAFAIGAIGKSFAQQVIDALEALATSPDPRRRAAALRAAGEVREPALVPELIRSLADPDDTVVAAAREALIRTTRQDFGTEARRWQDWWSRNESRDRLEWLIDALSHEVPDVRRASGEELRVLSRQYFGYASDLPLRDRERAQQRYRDWWITEGRAQRRWA